MSRYARLFERLARERAGAFVPFAVLGDPSPTECLPLLEALCRAGADALELGVPFSDPIADGPVIQAADARALAAGTRPAKALAIVASLRRSHPELPIGLLVYANLLEARGRQRFYEEAAASGVDSVLVADVPTLEAAPYAAAAVAAGVEPVLVAAPNGTDAELAAIAAMSRGYTYVVSRAGVTGVDREPGAAQGGLITRLKARGAAPPLVGFGISTPAHVGAAIAAGAAGAICGSAVVARIAAQRDDPAGCAATLEDFVRAMKAATTAAS